MGDGVSWALVSEDRETKARREISMAEISAEREGEGDGGGRKDGRR